MIQLGRPLWSYKMTDPELAELQQLLIGVTQAQSLRSVIARFEPHYAEAFVLFASTWLQRNSAGRPMWLPLLKAINAEEMDQSDRMALVERGLERWGLAVFHTKTSSRFLDSLACQGGFPRSDLLLQTASHIMDYFEEVLARYDKYQHSENLADIATDCLELLPVTLRQSSFSALIVELIECLLEWKTAYNLGDFKNPVEVLEVERPFWRDELPFLVLDKEANTLINKILYRTSQFRRREFNPIRIKRQLVPCDGGFRLAANVYVAKEMRSEDLEKYVGNQNLPNSFFVNTDTSDSSRFRTAGFSLISGPSAAWRVSTYHTKVKNSVAADEIKYSIDSDGRQLAEGIYPKGEALAEGMPWVFQVSSSSLNYIGQGAVKSNASRLFVASSSPPRAATMLSSSKHIGALLGTKLAVYEVTGKVTVDGQAGDFNIVCQAGANEDYQVFVETPIHHSISAKHPVYLGSPVIKAIQRDHESEIAASELYWHRRGCGELLPLGSSEALGQGAIVWLRDGEVLWEAPAVILPEDFEYSVVALDDGSFELYISNSAGAKIGYVSQDPNWKMSSAEAGDTHIRAYFSARNVNEESLNIFLKWDELEDAECQISIPIAFNLASIVNRQGETFRELDAGSLTVAELANMRMRIRTAQDISDVRVVAHLLGPPNAIGNEAVLIKKTISVTVDCRHGMSLIFGSQFALGIENIFNHADELDSSISLAVYSGGYEIPNIIPRIRRYKHDLSFSDDGHTATIKRTQAAANADTLSLFMSPIWNFGQEPILLQPDDPEATILKYKLPEIERAEYGAWLIWASPDMSVRPRIKTYAVPNRLQDPKKLGALGAQLLAAMNDDNEQQEVFHEYLKEGSVPYHVKYLEPNDPASLHALNASVYAMGRDPDHPDWEYFDRIVERIDALEPLALYAMTSLQRNDEALVSLLLRNGENFQRIWNLTERLGISWHLIPVEAWVQGISQYFDRYKKAFNSFRKTDENVFYTLIYRPFSRLEAKGEYFKYLVCLGTGRDEFFHSEVWRNDDLPSAENTQESIGELFLRARSELFDRHSGKFLTSIGTRKETERFLQVVEEQFPSAVGLPSDLEKLVRYTIPNATEYGTKELAWALSLRLPLQVGFYISGFYKPRLPRRFPMLLRYTIALLDEFDSEWLNQALKVAHMSYSYTSKKDVPILEDREHT